MEEESVAAAPAADGALERYQGTDLDVRVLVARMPKEVKDGFRYEQIPWHRFHHAYGPGVDVPQRLEALRSGEHQQARQALRLLGGSICHAGQTTAAGALAVPFLIRIATAPDVHHRAGVLSLIGALAHREAYGDGTRAGLLRVADREIRYDCGGYVMNWSVEAGRAAVADDADLLVPLLHDPDPEVRAAACYALATASARLEEIGGAFRDRLTSETTPLMRASLVLATAQLGQEHDREGATAWARDLWSDTAQAPEIRMSAALAFLCLTEGPISDRLRSFLTIGVTDEPARSMAEVPWIAEVEWQGEGLAKCVDQMFHPEAYWWFDPEAHPPGERSEASSEAELEDLWQALSAGNAEPAD